ncbi:MAG TPA: DEAD/DEAH box helicase, partial [Actinomycetota bacterium]|nr:DEAD/DEAH box helicase [Actinomycetota bacterium]
MSVAPASLTPSFPELGVSSTVDRVLSERGMSSPFPIQALVIPDALEGHDVLGRSKTGSGKTLAFAVPIVERLRAEDPRPAALVLVPTRELAAQVGEDVEPIARARGLGVAVVHGGGGPRAPQRGRRREGGGHKPSAAHVVIATPGRLNDLVDRGALGLGTIRILVLDEADRMLDMGFQPQ